MGTRKARGKKRAEAGRSETSSPKAGRLFFGFTFTRQFKSMQKATSSIAAACGYTRHRETGGRYLQGTSFGIKISFSRHLEEHKKC